MPFSCSFCKIRGEKGYFSYPKAGPQRDECLGLAGLPPEQDLKVKISSLRICFRHYQESDFFFIDGGQARLKRGDFLNVNEGVLFLQRTGIKNLC